MGVLSQSFARDRATEMERNAGPPGLANQSELPTPAPPLVHLVPRKTPGKNFPGGPVPRIGISLPVQGPEGKIGLPRANPRGRLRSPS